jgi:Lon protease-like protein
MAAAQRKNVCLFPLGTVLFPGGALPLKIFEQRYMEMTKACLRDGLPFGVCLIREGHEVGTAAVPESVGCLATIEHWDMPHTGMFHLLARGGERFRVLETQVAANGLLSGEVEMLPPVATGVPDADCVALLQRVIAQVGAENFPQPVRLDDATWVAYRLAEMLPLVMAEKQLLLQMPLASELLERIKISIKTNT